MKRMSIIVDRLKGWEQQKGWAGFCNSKMPMVEREIVERKRRGVLVLAFPYPHNVQLLP